MISEWRQVENRVVPITSLFLLIFPEMLQFNKQTIVFFQLEGKRQHFWDEQR